MIPSCSLSFHRGTPRYFLGISNVGLGRLPRTVPRAAQECPEWPWNNLRTARNILAFLQMNTRIVRIFPNSWNITPNLLQIKPPKARNRTPNLPEFNPWASQVELPLLRKHKTKLVQSKSQSFWTQAPTSWSAATRNSHHDVHKIISVNPYTVEFCQISLNQPHARPLGEINLNFDAAPAITCRFGSPGLKPPHAQDFILSSVSTNPLIDLFCKLPLFPQSW